MKVISDYFNTLFTGLARNQIVLGLIRSIHQPPQQQ